MSNNFIMTPSDPADDYELRDEYDLSKLPIVAQGRFAPEHRMGKNVAVLEPDVAEAFPNDQAVNDALRLIMQLAKIPQPASASVPNR